MTVKRSANEIAALILKSGRGAGWPLGVAEDTARAAPFLAEQGALSVLCDWLDQEPEVPHYDGVLVSGGHAAFGLVTLLDLRQAGFTARLEPELARSIPQVVMQAFERARSAPAPAGPFDIAQDVWAALAEHAALTFVPESSASRASGAGAGTHDTD